MRLAPTLTRVLPVALALLLITSGSASPLRAQTTHKIGVSGTRFTFDGAPFAYTGLSFFNAIYNPAFNAGADARKEWLRRFRRFGVNVLRIWGEWDNRRGFVDACGTCTLYHDDGRLRQQHLETLKAIVSDADEQEMVVLLVLFARESWNEDIRLSPEAADRAVAALTRALQPYRNVVFQIWNEHNDRVLEHLETIKALDPSRLVTNSPGYGGDLGERQEDEALDFLSPHTSRNGPHWETAPREIALLLQKYGKPVVDDEPARSGIARFGGPSGETSPFDQILHIYNVRKEGGYVVYHHDMFQTGYGSEAVPPSGIPDPEFSPRHRQVFDFLALRGRYSTERQRASQ